MLVWSWSWSRSATAGRSTVRVPLAFFADHGLAFTQFIGRDDFPVGTAQSSIDTLPLLSNIRPSAAHPLEAFWRLFRLGKTEILLQTALGV